MDANLVSEIVALAQQSMVHEETYVPAMVLSEKCEIKSLEHLLSAPAHFRATLGTRFTDQFTSYVNENLTDNTHVFVDSESLSATAIFDMGDQGEPMWGHHRATVKITQEPEYKAVISNNTTPMTQVDLVNFVEDWSSNIQFYAGDDLLDLKDAINRIRRIKVNVNNESTSTQGDFNQSRSALENIEVQSDGNTLPDGFKFTCKPYEDLPEKTINCKLRAHTGEKLQLSYRIVGASALDKELTNDFCFLIASELKDATVTIGTMTYQR